MIEGDLILRIVSQGTGSESTVSSSALLLIITEPESETVLTDSGKVGWVKNPWGVPSAGTRCRIGSSRRTVG